MEYISKFLEYLQQQERSALTIRTYKQDLTSFYKWFEQENLDADFRDVCGEDLRSYKQYLCQHQASRAGKPGLMAASVNRKLSAVKSFLQWACRSGVVESRILLELPRPMKQQQRTPRWLDRKEQARLIRAAEDDTRAWSIVVLLLETGLRVSELCSLTHRDVAISDRKGVLTVTGKGRKQRSIPLTRRARIALEQLGAGTGENKPLIVGQRGPMTARGIESMIAKLAEKAKLQEVTVHSLRHSFAKNLTISGAGLEAVAALCGHENLNTTRIYIEPSFKELQRLMEIHDSESELAHMR